MLNLGFRRLRARFTLLAVVALSALLLRSVAFAQTSVSNGSISGTVTDTTGAVVPNAKVTTGSNMSALIPSPCTKRSGGPDRRSLKYRSSDGAGEFNKVSAFLSFTDRRNRAGVGRHNGATSAGAVLDFIDQEFGGVLPPTTMLHR